MYIEPSSLRNTGRKTLKPEVIRVGKKDNGFLSIRMKRTYEAPDEADGFRILVDRLWPIGVAKERARIDLWFKDIAPSSELRKWSGHDPEKWGEFKERYFSELDAHPELIDLLWNKIEEEGKVTLVYSAKDEDHNNAVALKDYLVERAAPGKQ